MLCLPSRRGEWRYVFVVSGLKGLEMTAFLRKKKQLKTGVVAVLAALGLILSGCQGATSSPTTVNLTDSGAEIEAVTVAFPGSLANLYIGQEAGILNYNLAATVQEGLVGINSEGTVVPALAESWETPDDRTFVFTLRSDAYFHNGDAVTADDVVFSVEQAADPEGSPGTYWYLTNLESVEKTGDREVTVTSVIPDAAFLVGLSSAGALVVTQQAYWEQHDGNIGTSDSLLLGTGPYKVTEFQPDSHVLLERADKWWGGVPAAKSIRVNFIPDASTRLAAAQRGDIDIALNVPISQAQDWAGISGWRVEAVNDLSYVGLIYDQSVSPFDNDAVRAAIAHAIDRDAIAEKLLRGFGEKATAIMTPESLAAAYDGDAARDLLSSIPQKDYDVDRAQALMAEAGVDSFSIEMTYPNTGPQLGVAAQAIAENLKEIGIDVDVREVPIEEWLATIGDGEHGLGFMWYFSTTGDPSEVNSYLIGEWNPNAFESETADSLIGTASGLSDPSERIATLIELETLSAENTVNTPLWWGKSLTGFSNRIGARDYSPYTFVTTWGAQLFAAEAD
jgi:peptide/nickel transport system substrate-binding protein